METLFCKCEDCDSFIGLAEGQHHDDLGLCTSCSIKRELAEIQELSGKPGYEGFPAPCDLNKLFPIPNILHREHVDAILKAHFEGLKTLSELEVIMIEGVIARIANSMICHALGELSPKEPSD